MISISESAQSHFAKLLADQAEQTNIRVFVVNPGTSQAECGVSYCPEDAVEATDIRLPFNGFDAVVDAESAPFLEEAEIDFVRRPTALKTYICSANRPAPARRRRPPHFCADIHDFLDTKKISADEDVRVKTLSIGVVIPDKFIELARENRPAYVFYPHTVYKAYGLFFLLCSPSKRLLL